MWQNSKTKIMTKLEIWQIPIYEEKHFKRMFSKNILTPWQPMRCSLGSVLRFLWYFCLSRYIYILINIMFSEKLKMSQLHCESKNASDKLYLFFTKETVFFFSFTGFNKCEKLERRGRWSKDWRGCKALERKYSIGCKP